jgi:Fe-S cluster assembly scaffold protein SufB
MSELNDLMKAFGEAGGDKAILENNEIAHLVASGHTLLSMKSVEGLEVEARETRAGISAEVIVREGIKIKNPVHLCFGVLHKKVTHEAAIGSVDKRQMETLMAHGLTPEEAVDVIVKGILQ